MDTLLLNSDNLACGICDFQIAQTDDNRPDCFVTQTHNKEIKKRLFSFLHHQDKTKIGGATTRLVPLIRF